MKQSRLIVSVPHSGTRFLRDRLGWNRHRHTIGSYDVLQNDLKVYDYHVLIPMRHPQDVLRSWCSRQKHNQPYWLTQFAMSWAHLQHVHDICDSEIIVIEHCRDPRITNWEPVGNDDRKQSDGSEADYIDIKPVFELPIVRGIYEPRPVKQRP